MKRIGPFDDRFDLHTGIGVGNRFGYTAKFRTISFILVVRVWGVLHGPDRDLIAVCNFVAATLSPLLRARVYIH